MIMVMLEAWLALVVVILLTRALHCYLHYRAGREGVDMPTHASPVDGDAQNQAVTEAARAESETQPSQPQSDKKRQRLPRRRGTSKTAQAV